MKLVLKPIFLFLAILLGLVFVFTFDARKGGFPQCPFFLLTGWYCPGCGSQRALSALVHGDFFEAIGYNVLMMLFLPVLLYSTFIDVRYTGSRKLQLWYNPIFVKIVLIIVICFWLFRNIPVYPFSLLAPTK